uniref:Uncharacterized protein n=1 Tax=Neisseria lactamica TaxID=486 RepID=Q0QVZ3_NEILA|nr:hypothetical protein [Neisseria lactamica]ABB71603.1 hypothetical protein [Neisseria lactamica]
MKYHVSAWLPAAETGGSPIIQEFHFDDESEAKAFYDKWEDDPDRREFSIAYHSQFGYPYSYYEDDEGNQFYWDGSPMHDDEGNQLYPNGNPFYNGVRQVRQMEFPVACVKSSNSCHCYSSQATVLKEIDKKTCIDYVDNGMPFNPYKDEQREIQIDTAEQQSLKKQVLVMDAAK